MAAEGVSTWGSQNRAVPGCTDLKVESIPGVPRRSWNKGMACQAGRERDVYAGWFCQDGRMPILSLYCFAIDSGIKMRYSGLFRSNLKKEEGKAYRGLTRINADQKKSFTTDSH
jgi:hypothetical protein